MICTCDQKMSTHQCIFVETVSRYNAHFSIRRTFAENTSSYRNDTLEPTFTPIHRVISKHLNNYASSNVTVDDLKLLIFCLKNIY